MKVSNYLISALDVLLIIATILFLAVFSIANDEDKGLKDLDFMGITILEESSDIEGVNVYDFYGLVLSDEGIEVVHYHDGKGRTLNIINSIADLQSTIPVTSDRVYVIYEKNKNPFFANVARYFAIRNVPFGIARVIHEP